LVKNDPVLRAKTTPIRKKNSLFPLFEKKS